MDIFIPNGLLGNSVEIPVSPELNFNDPTIFVSNGLLDQIVPTSPGTFQPVNPLSDKPQNVSFTNDGEADSPAQFFSSKSKTTTSAPQLDDFGDMFSPNGLLPMSQDDHMPTVAEAFDIPMQPITSNSLFSSSNTSSRNTVRATTFDGKTLYLKKKAVKIARKRVAQQASAHPVGNLLDVPIHRMMDELSSHLVTKLGQPETVNVVQPKDVEDTLWVDRYRPERFVDLMGNERVARETMSWVKQWDWCVFGRKKGKRRPQDGDEQYNADDIYHRPRNRFLLLSGPPGLGKTTLAHVIARQAGYEVIEINASDARAGSTVDERILPTLEAGSTVGSSKPVLLIIDEIDGATGAGDNSSTFIHKLVQLTFDKPKKHKGKRKGPRPILRPIICICNDHNASSLAKLRPHAYQVRFTRPADVQTVKRLREVCEMEGLRADSRALSTLVGVAKGDLRGCLNALQFIKSRSDEVTEAIIRSATVGMKEGDEATTASVLNDLFTPLAKRRVKELAMGDEEEARYVARLSQQVESSGREVAIAAGCFTHYTTLRQHDANLSRHEKANEWLTVYDMFSGAMYMEGEFALNQYLPYTLVPFYPLFQERGSQRVERSQVDWEHLQLVRSNEEICKSVGRCLRTASGLLGGDYRQFCSTPVLQLEFLPYINRIISPPLRPVNSQVIRPEERALLSRLVSIMSNLELRFFQERAEDGQLSYRLDPPVDVFITYDGKRAADISLSRYAVRHMVAGEIDAQVIARQSDVIEKGTRGKHSFFGDANQPKKADGSDRIDARPSTNVAIIDIADKPPTDFFGRPITTPSTTSVKTAARQNLAKKYRVLYRFTEGNSSAVRKPVKVGTFL